MAVKLFMLGCPGSGKSTMARHIVEYVQQNHREWGATHFNDYELLYQMFKKDTEHSLFWPTEPEGFIVRERSVYNTVLKKLEEKVNHFYSISTNNALVIFEFARSNYDEAFKQFGSGFLQNAYFLFLDADINRCIQRTRERVLDAKTKDDYFVSEHVFEHYYHNKNKDYLYSPLFKRQYEVGEARIRIINNQGSEQACTELVDRFVDFIYKREYGTSNDVKLPALALS